MNKRNDIKYRYYIGPEEKATHPINVILIGVGGNGTNVLTDLARMHYVLVKLEHPGLDVVAYDADKVTPANCGRQLFSPGEIGLNKAICMITRINNFFGLDWEGYACNFDEATWKNQVDYAWDCNRVVISCVDSAKARLSINNIIKHTQNCLSLWLDIGNTKSTGQGIIGSHGYRKQPSVDGVGSVIRMPTVIDLYPDIAEHDSGQEAVPSCSVAEALSRQDLFINKAISTLSMKILFDGIMQGYFDIHGVFMNLESMQMSSLQVSPAAWAKMGYSHEDEQVALELIHFLRKKGIPVDKAVGLFKGDYSPEEFKARFEELLNNK